MSLDEVKISRAIIGSYKDKLEGCLEVDVAIVGAGPAGLSCLSPLEEDSLLETSRMC